MSIVCWGDELEDAYGWVLEQLGRFTYKPGWIVEANRSPQHGGIMVTIAFHAEDSRRGPNQIPRYREMTFTAGEPFRVERDDLITIAGNFVLDSYVFEHHSDKFLYDWLRHKISVMDQHEIDEWFRVDGQLLNDPHVGEQQTGRRHGG